MGFFDLSMPYYESDKHIADKSARKTTRLKLMVKAMELGYTGVAYNRNIKGVMSESDRCATSLFPLSSVLKLAPSLSSTVKLHRDLLGVPVSVPFRQYTRLTVIVDSSSQALALNSGNPILKTYDIIAVRPMNQNAFEQACQASEVDLISIDFSDKLLFRLKQPMVKAAIQRGIYFEITYSALVMDVQVRRQMISNAKLLVDWTRGKNLIISSAAPTVTEMRGPYDVANLSSLLGLPMEQAKAALSKNCRSLIAKALRKKYYYKEAIRVETIPSGEQFDFKEPWPSNWMKWDPISSGEGDLPLDDMAKFFSATNVSKTIKPIDFASIMDNLSSRGLQVQDLRSVTEATVQSSETEVSIAKTGLLDLSKTDQNSLHINPSKHQNYSGEDSVKVISSTQKQRELSNEEGQHKTSDGSDVSVTPLGIENFNLQSQNCFRRCDTRVVLQNDSATLLNSAMDTASACEAVADAEYSTPLNNNDSFAFQSEESRKSNQSDLALGNQYDAMKEVLIERNPEAEGDLSLNSYKLNVMKKKFREIRGAPIAINDASPLVVSHDEVKGINDHIVLKEVLTQTNIEVNRYLSLNSYNLDGTKCGQFEEIRDASIAFTHVLPIVVSHNEMEDKSDHIAANWEPINEVTMEEKKQVEDHTEVDSPVLDDSSGKRKMKLRAWNQAFVFPLKRLLNRTPFKRKASKSKSKTLLF